MIDKTNFYINGKWVKPLKENNFDVINPSTEKMYAKISLGSKEDLEPFQTVFPLGTLFLFGELQPN